MSVARAGQLNSMKKGKELVNYCLKLWSEI